VNKISTTFLSKLQVKTPVRKQVHGTIYPSLSPTALTFKKYLNAYSDLVYLFRARLSDYWLCKAPL